MLTLAGDGSAGSSDGVGLSSKFSSPRGLSFDYNGNLLIADTGNNRTQNQYCFIATVLKKRLTWL